MRGATSNGHRRKRTKVLPEDEHLNEPHLKELIFGVVHVKPKVSSFPATRPNNKPISSLQWRADSLIGISNVTAVTDSPVLSIGGWPSLR